jgi:hypothetical protein
MDQQVEQWAVCSAGMMAEQWAGRWVAWMAGQMAVWTDEF